ncbi:MAG TPA: hypothetical protein VG603_14630 [Chitinophagales bacterium]|nr:hypothetical protein [Chitinophagales bacterium]
MKKNILLIAIPALMVIFSCKKDKTAAVIQPKYVQLDVPFRMSTMDTCILLDTVGTTVNKVTIFIAAIDDHRAFGFDCSSSTGGEAYIRPEMILNDTASIIGLQDMPGCTAGDEYDTINQNIPKCILDNYVLYLLRLNPYDSHPKSFSGYTVDYLIGKR